jgi:hypothetical protein
MFLYEINICIGCDPGEANVEFNFGPDGKKFLDYPGPVGRSLMEDVARKCLSQYIATKKESEAAE